ncbi:MAG: hypothetical protein AABY84_05395 [Candidatus Firestonebacteria bacterium]
MKNIEKHAWQYSALDKGVTDRFKKIGDLGESLAEKLLKKNGFKNVKNLNKTTKNNNKYADIFAEHGNQAYVISVKTRNKFENTGRLNSRYKLGKDCYEFAKQAETEHRAKAAWVTISLDIDKKIFDAYFGLLSDLEGNTGVLMTPDATRNYKCLAFHYLFEKMGLTEDKYVHLKNTYKPRKN